MKRNDAQVCLKLAGPLREALDADAATRERSVSWVIRKILINHYAPRIVERATADVGAAHGQV
jgi:hypothetical protein